MLWTAISHPSPYHRFYSSSGGYKSACAGQGFVDRCRRAWLTQLRSTFEIFKIPAIDSYFDNSFSRACIARDLMRYERGDADFYPLQVVEPVISPRYNTAISDIKDILHELATPNYLLFR